jgi:Protein of unknown function (DUF3592)
MRIFPKGARDWLEPTGKAMITLACCMLAIAAGTFALKTWILYSWSRTDGTVVKSHVERMTSDDGTITCSAVESVRYAVDGRDSFIENGGHTFTSDCASVQKAVANAPGQSRVVAYNKRAPGATYVNPGFTIEFYLVAFVLTCMAGAFAFAGWAGIRVGRWMVKRDIDFP